MLFYLRDRVAFDNFYLEGGSQKGSPFFVVIFLEGCFMDDGKNDIDDLHDFYKLALKYEFIEIDELRKILLQFSILRRNRSYLKSE